MAKLTPSTLESKEICPCFDYASREELNDGAADEGILMHKAAETGCMDGLNEEQKECVENALIYVKGIIEGHLPNTLRTILREEKLKIPILKCNGIMDFVALFVDNTAEGVDYKFGRRGATVAEDNVQMFCYALALFEKFEKLESVRMHIVQARMREPMAPHIFTRADIPRMTERITKIMVAAEHPFKVPTAHDPDLCVRCAYTKECPAMSKTVQNVCAELVEDKSLLPAVWKVNEIVNVTDRAKIHIMAPMIVEWLDAVKRSNVEFVKSGGEIPGLKFVNRAGKKTIVSTVDAVERLRTSGTLADFDIWPTCTLSFTKLSEQLAAVQQCTKDEAKSRLEAVLGTLVAEEMPIQYLQKTKVSKKGTADAS